jgi:hypothetical protein
MELLVAIYLLLGAYTASFIRGINEHSATDGLILAGIHIACLALAAFMIWPYRHRKSAFVWLGLMFATYSIGFGYMWFNNS